MPTNRCWVFMGKGWQGGRMWGSRGGLQLLHDCMQKTR